MRAILTTFAIAFTLATLAYAQPITSASPSKSERPVPKPPNLDYDHDGVPDTDDKCVREPAGSNPNPELPGCPIFDNDEDTVPNAKDACPNQRGAPQTDPKQNGCPGLVEVRAGMIMILSPISFTRGKNRILKRSFAVLDAVADALKAKPDIGLVSIEGHTNNRGSNQKNLKLSQRRAQAVREYLVNTKGIAPGRLEVYGFGETRPIIPNRDKQGRATNQRIEFRIVPTPL